jgi:hypothetical protein
VDDETRDEEYQVTLRLVPGGEREYGTVGLLRDCGTDEGEQLRREHREVSLAAWQRRLAQRDAALAEQARRQAETSEFLAHRAACLRGATAALVVSLLLLAAGVAAALWLADQALPR